MIDHAHIQLLPGMDGTGRLFRWLVHALEPEARATVVNYPVDRPMRCRELADLVHGLRGLRAIQRVRPEVESVTLDGPHLLLQARPEEAATVIKRYAQRWAAT